MKTAWKGCCVMVTPLGITHFYQKSSNLTSVPKKFTFWLCWWSTIAQQSNASANQLHCCHWFSATGECTLEGGGSSAHTIQFILVHYHYFLLDFILLTIQEQVSCMHIYINWHNKRSLRDGVWKMMVLMMCSEFTPTIGNGKVNAIQMTIMVLWLQRRKETEKQQ